MINLAMGATHIDHDKLVDVVNTISRQTEQLAVKPGSVDYSKMSKISKFGQGYDKMMSLYNYDDVRLTALKYVPEVKYDGYSYLFTEGEFASRNLSTAVGTVGQPIFKSDHIPHLTKIMKSLYNNFGIDIQGEIIIPGGTSDDVTKIMGCTVEKALERQLHGAKPHYKWIDIRSYFGINVMKEPYWMRRALMENIFYNRVPDEMKKYIDISEIMPDAVESFKKIILDGGEGLVIKDVHKIYIPGKKPSGTWIKCKREVTLDAIITGYNKGTGKNASMFGSIQISLYVDGKLTDIGNVSSGISDQIRLDISNNPEWFKGKIIEVSAMQPNKGKLSFRHLTFKGFRLNSDKSAEDCTMDGIVPKTEII